MRIRIKMICICLLLCTLSHISAQDVWLTDFEAAKAFAAEEQKMLLLNFSGSDWCKPCMRWKKEVFETADFKAYASEHLVCVLVDFPRRRKNRISMALRRQNEHLAEQYNADGYFPHIVLLSSDGNVVARSEYRPGGIAALKAFIDPHIPASDMRYQERFYAMGSKFEISVVCPDESRARMAIDVARHEIMRIERLISSWDPASQTTTINTNAGIAAVRVDYELYALIQRALRVSELTRGAFDITFAAMDSLWYFDGTMTELPDTRRIAESVRSVNYQRVLLNPGDTSVFLQWPNMKIGFGAIGKGYAANRAVQVMKNLGIRAGIVNAGGDLLSWGLQLDGSTFKIGIADPASRSKTLAWLELHDTALVTSGDYERYAEIDGVRYAHIIDPRTGYPATGLKSVSVLCADAELADALATAVFVMGPDHGLSFINQLEGVECLLVDTNDRILASDHLSIISDEK